MRGRRSALAGLRVRISTLKQGIERSDAPVQPDPYLEGVRDLPGARVALEGQVGIRGAGGHPIVVIVYDAPHGRIADLL